MFILKLFIVGNSPKSSKLVASFRSLLDEICAGDYTLEVIDVLANSDLAEQESILATPTIVRNHPAPALRVIGDMTDPLKVLDLLGLIAGHC